MNNRNHRLEQTASTDPAAGGTIIINSNGTETINGYNINTTDWTAFPLGVISGLQYDNSSFGSCFNSMILTTNFATYFENDLLNLVTNGDYYNLAVYDPIHLSRNIVVVYE